MEQFSQFFEGISFQQTLSSFLVLFAVIDITGAIPIIMGINNSGQKVKAGKAAAVSLAIYIAFFFAGDLLLKLFNTDIESFAIAGSLILFALAIEMTFSIEIFKNDGPEGYSTIVPVVFPLIAGAGGLTTTLSLRAQYSDINILLALIINMAVVYIVIRNVGLVEKIIGKGGIYILRKFFGVILLAMATSMFISNLQVLMAR